jgi:TM2 domain-containing membrane protein YozV
MSDLKQHVSDVDTWGGADRNWYVFVVLSVLFGLVGGDHFYLRSFKTGFQKAFLNLLTFGAWYWWDLSQIIWQRDTVLREGLSSPLDWIRNIGRGVFTTPTSPSLIADKSYVVFALLAVFFGLLGADKFYMGSPIQGLAKLILCFNLFTFLIGWAWVAWDAFHATFMTEDLLKNGIQAPVGLNAVFGPIDSKAFRLHKEREGALGLAEPYLSAVGLTTDGVIGDWINGFVCTYGALFGLSHSHTDKCVKHTVPVSSVSPVVAPPQVKQRGGAVLEPATHIIQEGGAAPGGPSSARTDSGGPSSARTDSGGPGPVIAGALAAVVITAGLKGTYDFIRQQHG